MNNDGFSTRSVHSAENPEDNKAGDAISPVHLSTTFAKDSIEGIEDGYVYSRTGNPTRNLLEKKLASLEKAEFGLAFSSGMAAETNILLSLLKEGNHLLAFDDLYSGTKRLFNQVMTKFGLEFDYVDATDPKNIKNGIKEDTRIIWLESPTNPLMKLSDIEKISRIAHEKGVVVVVDNTFATPYFQKPLTLGADVVVHSLTKYLGGHSDVVGGVAITNDKDLHERMKFHQNAAGAILSPFDSWMVNRGVKSLKPRMEVHQENALRIASFLEGHSGVEKVYYPGLDSHPQHQLAQEQMDGFGGMLSFEVGGGAEVARFFVESLDTFALAESLGGVESLVEIPALMTHANMSKEEMEEIGINGGLIRLSPGIEEFEDLISDLKKGLKKV